MSTSSTITNLQQALNCASKCDCCANLQQQINTLNQRINAIKPVDEKRIINQAVLGSQNTIIPQIAGIAASVFASKINPFNSRLGGVERAVPDATALARQALERAYQADSAARSAGNIAQNALSSAGSALGKIGALAAKVAGIAALIATILGTLATIAVLGGRIDALEDAIANLSNGLSQILGLLNPIKQQAQRAESKADTANDRANKAEAIANRASGEAGRAREVADGAARTAQEAISKAISASNTANQAKTTADTANRKADEVRAFVNPLPGRIDEAKRKADEADRKAEELKKAFPPIERLAGQAKTTADKALRRINEFLRNPPKGLKGDPGQPGKPGKNGKDGKDGRPGRDGLPGQNGQPGKNGNPGLRGFPGFPGRPGRDGKDGKNGKDGKDGKDVDKAELAKLNQKLDRIPPLFALIPRPLDFNQTVNAAATGTCKTTQPGGCTNKLVNDAADKVNQNSNNKFDLLNGVNAIANAKQLEILNTINGKLGTKLKNGIGGAINSVVNNQVVQSTVNYLTLATTIHNGLMLSRNFAETLFSTVDIVLKVFGINLKNAEGEEIGTGAVINNAIKALIISMVGEAQFKATSETWTRASRIYQASANLLNAVQSIGQSVLNALQVVGGNVGKIGNALRIWGEVSDKAYNFMNPQPNFQNRFFTGLETAETVVSHINSVASETLSAKETIGQLGTLKADLDKNLKGDEGSKPSPAVPEAVNVKAQVAESKLASLGKEMVETDLDPDETPDEPPEVTQ